METFQTFVLALLSLLAKAAPWIILGYLIAAVIKEFVPLAVFVRYFAGKGVKPILRAIGVGLLLPICSCGVIPVGIGAFKQGASRGTALAFMTGAPALSPAALLMTFSMLETRLAFCTVVASLIGSFLIGLIANHRLAGPEEDALREAKLKKARRKEESLPVSENRTFPAKVRGAAKWAFWDLGTDISVDLMLGLTIAAGLLAVLPAGWVSAWLGQQNVLTLLCVMVVGIPLYTCTMPSIPIAQSLLLLGMTPGAAITYLISGPATNLGEVAVVKRNLGGRTAFAFVAGLLTLAFIGGLLTDWLIFPGYQPRAVTGTGPSVVTDVFLASMTSAEDRTAAMRASLLALPWWHLALMGILSAAMVVGLARRAAGFWEKRRTKKAVVEA